MSNFIRILTSVVISGFFFGAPDEADAQLDHLPLMMKYRTGQNVQPIFQGWSRNDDGTFEMHLGYLNRNYNEELHIPIGPDNHIEPGGPDQGQPTYFYTRANRQIFSVTVPADWGDKRLIWTLTAYGRTDVTEAWLQPEWEIDPVTGGFVRGEEWLRNQPPILSLNVGTTASVSTGMRLEGSVTDDNLPTPRGQRQMQRNRAIGQEIPPILIPPEGTPEPPNNVPGLNVNARGRQAVESAPEGLSMSYRVWRGPAGVTFEPKFSMVEGGSATTTASFSVPGSYVIQASANDGQKSTTELFAVTVN